VSGAASIAYAFTKAVIILAVTAGGAITVYNFILPVFEIWQSNFPWLQQHFVVAIAAAFVIKIALGLCLYHWCPARWRSSAWRAIKSTATTTGAWYWRNTKAAIHPLCAMLWFAFGLALKLLSLGAIDLQAKKLDKGAMQQIWGLLWPFLVSPEKTAIVMPETIRLPTLEVRGWQCHLPAWTLTAWLRGGVRMRLRSLIIGLSLTGVTGLLGFVLMIAIVAHHEGLIAQGASVGFGEYLQQALPIALAHATDGPALVFETVLGFVILQLVAHLPLPILTSKEVRLPYGGKTIVTVPEWLRTWVFIFLATAGTWWINLLVLQTNELNGDLMNSLKEEDKGAFSDVFWGYLGVSLLYRIISPLTTQCQYVLKLDWLKFDSRLMMKLYLADGNYLPLAHSGTPDNPNVRLWDNLREMCFWGMEIFFTLMDAAFTLCLFLPVIWKLESGLSFAIPVGEQSLHVPHLLTVAIMIFAVFGTKGSNSVGKKLIELNSQLAQRGGDVVVRLVHIATFAEPLAIGRSGQREYDKLWWSYTQAMRISYRISSWERNLAFFTGAYGSFSTILPYAVLVPFYFTKAIDLGDITQSFGACTEILTAVSVIVSNYDTIARLVMSANRVGELREALLGVEAERKADRPCIKRTEGGIEDDRVLIIKDMTLNSPGGKRIVTDLNLPIRRHERVLIHGKSGRGKTSILRAIEGLDGWNSGSGTIQTLPWGRVIGLPQQALLVYNGSLREQLLYQSANEAADDELIATLHRVGLSDWFEGFQDQLLKASVVDYDHLCESDKQRELAVAKQAWNLMPDYQRHALLLAATINWDSLSGGEKQRLIVGRALINKVDLILADECTSALDDESALLIYRVISEAGIAMLSITHNPKLLPYVDRVLDLDCLGDDSHTGDGRWRVLPAAEWTC
jgi:putative ATP-binding cassette transporter